jgi:hypothetical protein
VDFGFGLSFHFCTTHHPASHTSVKAAAVCATTRHLSVRLSVAAFLEEIVSLGVLYIQPKPNFIDGVLCGFSQSYFIVTFSQFCP